MLHPVEGERWDALAPPGRRCRAGARVSVGAGAAAVRIVAEKADGVREVTVEPPWAVTELLDRHGLPPLPPYIARHDAPKPDDRERYQTVYARHRGSVAAPTAGLHFTASSWRTIAAGAPGSLSSHSTSGDGTFRPSGPSASRTTRWRGTSLSEETAAAVHRVRAEGRRIVAIGTTTTRALEWAATDGRLPAVSAPPISTSIPAIGSGVVDALVTNFHLPRSTLLLLAAAFCGREALLRAYRHAVADRFRFYSYGDAMLIA